MKKIAVLIPCYNEAQTVGKVVSDYKKALEKHESEQKKTCNSEG